MEAAELKRISTLTVWSLNIQLLWWQHWLQTSLIYYIHHSQKKLYDPEKITHDMVLKCARIDENLATPPPCPHENLCLRELRFLHRIMALKVHLTGVSPWTSRLLSEHHPWSMSKFWENKVMVVILAHHTWSPQPSPREWKAKSWVAPQLLRRAVWLCWPLASLQPPDFFGRARAVVWFPCRRDLGEWLDMDSRRKGFFCLKKWARFTRMVSDGSSVPVWKDTNYVISCRDSGRIFMTPSLKIFTHPHHVSPNSHPLFSINVSFSLGFAGLAGSWSKRKNIPLLKQKNIKWLAYQLIDCISTGPTLPNIQDT